MDNLGSVRIDWMRDNRHFYVFSRTKGLENLLKSIPEIASVEVEPPGTYYYCKRKFFNRSDKYVIESKIMEVLSNFFEEREKKVMDNKKYDIKIFWCGEWWFYVYTSQIGLTSHFLLTTGISQAKAVSGVPTAYYCKRTPLYSKEEVEQNVKATILDTIEYREKKENKMYKTTNKEEDLYFEWSKKSDTALYLYAQEGLIDILKKVHGIAFVNIEGVGKRYWIEIDKRYTKEEVEANIKASISSQTLVNTVTSKKYKLDINIDEFNKAIKEYHDKLLDHAVEKIYTKNNDILTELITSLEIQQSDKKTTYKKFFSKYELDMIMKRNLKPNRMLFDKYGAIIGRIVLSQSNVAEDGLALEITLYDKKD